MVSWTENGKQVDSTPAIHHSAEQYVNMNMCNSMIFLMKMAR